MIFRGVYSLPLLLYLMNYSFGFLLSFSSIFFNRLFVWAEDRATINGTITSNMTRPHVNANSKIPIRNISSRFLMDLNPASVMDASNHPDSLSQFPGALLEIIQFFTRHAE